MAPPRIALPFQTVETVNESTADRDRMQDLFASGRPTDWRNRLIWGDKKYVLPSLLDEFAGKVNLIYIDPPFATGGDFTFSADVPNDPGEDGEENGISFTKQPGVIEQKAYRDTWGRGLDGYLSWFHHTAVALRELLAVLVDGSHRLIETKGREDPDVAHKDRAARLWCENASQLTQHQWRYVKVSQKGFDSLQPTVFSDLRGFEG